MCSFSLKTVVPVSLFTALPGGPFGSAKSSQFCIELQQELNYKNKIVNKFP